MFIQRTLSSNTIEWDLDNYTVSYIGNYQWKSSETPDFNAPLAVQIKVETKDKEIPLFFMSHEELKNKITEDVKATLQVHAPIVYKAITDPRVHPEKKEMAQSMFEDLAFCATKDLAFAVCKHLLNSQSDVPFDPDKELQRCIIEMAKTLKNNAYAMLNTPDYTYKNDTFAAHNVYFVTRYQEELLPHLYQEDNGIRKLKFTHKITASDFDVPKNASDQELIESFTNYAQENFSGKESKPAADDLTNNKDDYTND